MTHGCDPVLGLGAGLAARVEGGLGARHSSQYPPPSPSTDTACVSASVSDSATVSASVLVLMPVPEICTSEPNNQQHPESPES